MNFTETKSHQVELISSFAPTVYSESEQIANQTKMFSKEPVSVSSESRFCTLVNGVAVEFLRNIGFNAKLIQSLSGLEDFVDHAHILIEKNTIADYQYLQFVPKEERQGLPPCLIITFQSQQDLSKKLSKHNIPLDLHHHWVS